AIQGRGRGRHPKGNHSLADLGWRRRSAHSEAWPLSKLVAMAISPQVTSAPRALHTRRKGRLPTVVSGARYSLSLKEMGLRSKSISGPKKQPTVEAKSAQPLNMEVTVNRRNIPM